MRVCIQPCLGFNTALSTVARQAAYLAHEELVGPERSDLGCLPALSAGVEEDVEFVRNDLVIAIEACGKRCSGEVTRKQGGEPAVTIMVDEFLQSTGIDADSLPLVHCELDHPAVKALAAEIQRVAEGLLSEESRK